MGVSMVFFSGIHAIESWRNGRRLKKAAEHVDIEVQWFRRRARTITVAECEDDAAMHQCVVSILRLAANVLVLRHKYLKVVP